ncbi:hypothetical protein BCR36DRAFT_338754 [Piromyces finnis]|uniref:F-box domain-containing protein n=1 Tax=Piromyces finnis TaxID=1754191 RepID=A0A1Y1UV15_9FUNG|nr:hypothetical protein BCR36DRAFT_338754 [Piromyces finnis]|eukprot:ORX41816.1 hypothetical protein BCR36DRAFT_338754 [Piromyces finnis]
MTYSNYDTIPDEILIRIFSFITNDNLNDIFNSLLVSKRWNKLATFALYNSLHFHNMNQRSNFFRGLLTNNEDQYYNEKKDKYLDISLLEREFFFNEKVNQQIENEMEVVDDSEITINDYPIPMKYVNYVKSINFGLSPDENSDANEDGSFNNNFEWRQHCVNSSLNIISIYCPNIISLNLSGCQYYDYVLSEFLETSKNLMYLDVSYSSIKQMGLLSILEAVSRSNNPIPLREINLSGIFRFWRLYREARFLPNLIKYAKDLRKIVILDCPDIMDEIIEECKSIRDNITIVYETKTPINEMYMKDYSDVKNDSSLTLSINNEIYV